MLDMGMKFIIVLLPEPFLLAVKLVVYVFIIYSDWLLADLETKLNKKESLRLCANTEKMIDLGLLKCYRIIV